MSNPNKKVSLAHFNMFIKIVELGSLSKAARELGLTPSAVSRSLATLEEDLGINLINRTTRVMTLTEPGKAFLDKAYHLMDELDNIVETVQQFNRPTGTLKITSSLAVGCSQLHQLILSYQKEYPEVEVQVNLDDKIINIHEEDYDIALRVTKEINSAQYEAQALFDVSWYYYASRDYLASSAELITPADIKNHACLVYPRMTMAGAWVFNNTKGEPSVSINTRAHISCNSSLFLLQCVLLNEGIACLPTYLANSYVNNGKLIRVLPDYSSGITHKLYAVYTKRKSGNPLVKSFITHVKNKIKNGYGF